MSTQLWEDRPIIMEHMFHVLGRYGGMSSERQTLVKRCNRCGLGKPHVDFYPLAGGKGGLHPVCKPCRREEQRLRYQRDKEKILLQQRARGKKRKDKEWAYKRKYGLTEEHVSQMIRAQGSRCLICLAVANLVVDHCHKTGIVRGLLCARCNMALGMFKDDPDIISRAVSYLEGCRSGLSE